MGKMAYEKQKQLFTRNVYLKEKNGEKLDMDCNAVRNQNMDSDSS